MNADFPENALEAYGEASAALARADERVALCANRPALLARIKLLEQEALGHLEGEPIIHDQLALEYGQSPWAWQRWPYAFTRAFAKPLPSPAPPTAEIVRRWLMDEATDGHPVDQRMAIIIHEDRLKGWERLALASARQPPLLASADLAAAFARIAPLGRGNNVIGAMLGDRLVTRSRRFSSGGIAAIGIMTKQIPWSGLLADIDDGEADDISERAHLWRRRLAWLDALAGGGAAVVELARRVDRWARLVDEACATKRSSSRLRRVAELAAEYPSLTASRLAGLTKVSRQGATHLLEEARAARIVREITQGKAFRRYVAAI